MKNLLAKKDIKEKVKIALKEDFGRYGDITSKILISKKTKLKASIVAKENAIVCGTEFAVQTFKALNSKIKIKVLKKDGSKVVKGNKIIDINGDAQSILIAERTALNFLGFMSGIATKTRKFVDIAAPYGVKIYSTRKTIAGLRQVQKYALTIGGAHVNSNYNSSHYLISPTFNPSAEYICLPSTSTTPSPTPTITPLFIIFFISILYSTNFESFKISPPNFTLPEPSALPRPGSPIHPK